MSCTSTNNSGSPPCNKTRRNQRYVVYPPKAKIEMSKFSGNDEQCVAWLNKAEEYFDIYNITTDIEKVKYASMHLEMPITGICGGKLTTSHTHGICSKMISSKGFKESMKTIFSQSLPDYNKKETSKNSHTNGNHSLPEYLD